MWRFAPAIPVIPKIDASLAAVLLGEVSYCTLWRMSNKINGFDVIDAYYLFPDGVAAMLLGRWLDKPVILTVCGTDLNLLPKFRLCRRQIQWAAEQAMALVTVSDALRQRLIHLGALPEKISVLRNAVDLELFRSPTGRHRKGTWRDRSHPALCRQPGRAEGT